jgi:5-(carboxyamino)imidazole ribonucleotide mutase
MKSVRLALLVGSKSDLPKVEGAIKTCRDFGVPLTVRVMSAHRTPAQVAEFAGTAAANGYLVLLCAAGGAAHLAGVVAAHTTLPVIGIPVPGGALQGVDALLATVQMPAGIPVACVALGGGGPENAALFALAILALNDPALAAKLREFRAGLQAKVAAADAEVQRELNAAKE